MIIFSFHNLIIILIYYILFYNLGYLNFDNNLLYYFLNFFIILFLF